METFRVLVDSRRKINSGIGRVSQWLSDNLIFDDYRDIEIINLTGVGHGYSDYNFRNNRVVTTKIKPFSHDEFYELPSLVDSLNVDVYVNPQTTWSPLHKTPSINIIHDLWAIRNPEWLPLRSDLIARFCVENVVYFNHLAEWFDDNKAEEMLTEFGHKEWMKAKKSNNKIWLGCWAQYAATVSLSSKCILVSPFIKLQVEKYFSLGRSSEVISNIPKPFILEKVESKEHFLTLSKLENRKNLDFLLDAYVEYCNESKNIVPLIIAGDPGYKSVAEKLISRINKMFKNGYPVCFKASVTDDELRDLFSKSYALIFPTHFEGFGLPALEGMLSGIPVIATKTGMMATDLGEYATLINGTSLTELSNAMLHAQMNSLDINTDHAKLAVNKFINQTNSKEKWKQSIKSLRTQYA